jgi:hypothetical protein
MTVTKAISGNPQKNNGCTIVKAGEVANADLAVNARTLRDNVSGEVSYGSKVVLAVSPTSSGNLGTFKGLTNGTFNKGNTPGVYIAKKLATTINGTANNVLLSGGSDFGGARSVNSLTTTRRLDEDSWNAVTGAVTKGANAGDSVDFGTDHAVLYSTNDVPGELTYKTGAPLPVNDNYKPRTNP